MIRLLLEPVNLLILDEPTNHLDMQSKDVLKEAIRAFDGTAIIVSHDREFLDGLVTKVYEFGGGRVKEYLGGIYDWLRKSSFQLSLTGGGTTATAAANSLTGKGVAPQGSSSETKLEGASSYAERKEQQKKVKRQEKAVKESEEKIARMEARIKEMDKLLSSPEHATDMKLIEEYSQTMQALDAENERWMQLAEELEEMTH